MNKLTPLFTLDTGEKVYWQGKPHPAHNRHLYQLYKLLEQKYLEEDTTLGNGCLAIWAAVITGIVFIVFVVMGEFTSWVDVLILLIITPIWSFIIFMISPLVLVPLISVLILILRVTQRFTEPNFKDIPNTQYDITDQRINWQFQTQSGELTYYFIFHQYVNRVVLKRIDGLDVIEWYGIVGPYKDGQITKITFVGVEDAMRLVRLVEVLRGESLRVWDWRNESGFLNQLHREGDEFVLQPDETVLWHSKPDVMRLTYAHYTNPSSIPSSTNNDLDVGKLMGGVATFLGVSFTAFLLDYFNLNRHLFIPIFLGVVFVLGSLSYIALRYIFRPENPLESDYTVTNQRVSWQYVLTSGVVEHHYIMLEQLTEVTLRRKGELDLMEWQQIISEDQKRHLPSQNHIEKIVFVGVKDAKQLVQSVEHARGKLLPLTDLRHEGKSGKKRKELT